MTHTPRSLCDSLAARVAGLGLLSARVLRVAVVLGAVMVAAEACGCPNCKDAVNTGDPDGLNVARGYFYSILLMLAMPCTLLGSFGVYVWRETQRMKRGNGGTPGPDVEHSYRQPVGPREP